MLFTFAFMLSKKNTYAAILDTGVFCFLNTAEKHNVTLYVTNKITGVCSPLEQFELISTSETFIAEILFAGGLVFQLFSRLTPLLFLWLSIGQLFLFLHFLWCANGAGPVNLAYAKVKCKVIYDRLATEKKNPGGQPLENSGDFDRSLTNPSSENFEKASARFHLECFRETTATSPGEQNLALAEFTWADYAIKRSFLSVEEEVQILADLEEHKLHPEVCLALWTDYVHRSKADPVADELRRRCLHYINWEAYFENTPELESVAEKQKAFDKEWEQFLENEKLWEQLLDSTALASLSAKAVDEFKVELSTERLDYMLFTKTYRDYCKPLTDYYIRSKLAGVPEEEVFSSPEFVFLSTKYTDSLVNYYSVIARYAGMDATPVTTREELITRLSDPALQPLGEQASRAIWVLKHSLARGDTFPGGTEFPSDTSSILVVDALRAQCSPFGYLNLFDNYEKTVENPRKSEFSQLSTIKALREDRIKCVIDHYPDAVRYAQFTDDKMPTEAKDLRIKLEHTLDIAGTKYHGSGLFELRDLWVTVLEQTWANEAADDLKQFGPTREWAVGSPQTAQRFHEAGCLVKNPDDAENSFFSLFAELLLPLGLLGCFLSTLVFVAFFTLLERKLMGLFQRREGPDRLGIEGLGQPFADGLKLLLKQLLVIKDSPKLTVYFFAPIVSLWISLLLWVFLPLSSAGALVSSEISLVLVLGFSSLGSYGIIFAGWASNNKYALLGAFRSVAQMISYEIIFSLLCMPVMLNAASANLRDFVYFQDSFGWFLCMLPVAAMFYLVSLAEASRTPFDLPEAEAELVAGFNVEYAALLFSLFFLGEYSGMGFLSGLYSCLFLGGWSLNPLGSGFLLTGLNPASYKGIKKSRLSAANLENLWSRDQIYAPAKELTSPLAQLLELEVSVSKIVLLCVSFVVLRAALPRMRFDQLTLLCWKYCFPLAFVLILWEASAFVFWLNADLSLAGSGETFFEELLSHSLPVVPFFGDKTRKTAFPAMVRPSPSDKEDSLVFMDSLMVSSNTSEPMKIKWGPVLVVNLEVNGKLVHHLAVTTVVTDKALVKKYVKILGVTRVNQLCIQKMQGSGCLTSVNPLGSNASFYPPGTLWVADNPDFRSGFKGYQHTLAEGPKNFLFGELWKKGLGVLFPRIDFGTFLFEKFTGVPTKEWAKFLSLKKIPKNSLPHAYVEKRLPWIDPNSSGSKAKLTFALNELLEIF